LWGDMGKKTEAGEGGGGKYLNKEKSVCTDRRGVTIIRCSSQGKRRSFEEYISDRV